MFNLGAGEIVLILVAALLILGPKRLPELARGIGKFLREFRRQTEDVRSVVEREFYKMDHEIDQVSSQITAPLPPGTPSGQATPAKSPADESEPGHPDDERPPQEVSAEAGPPVPVPAPEAKAKAKPTELAAPAPPEGERH